MGTNLGRCGQCFAYPIYEIENSRRTLPINAGFEDGEREPAVKKCVWPPEAGKGNKKKFFPRASRKDNRHVNPIIQGDPCQTSEFYISAL